MTQGMQTITMNRQFAQAVGLVGNIVTVPGQTGQFKVHAVEGTDWYAFDENGMTTVDCALHPCQWITEPRAHLIPAGHGLGEGFGQVVELGKIRRGVNLDKSYR